MNSSAMPILLALLALPAVADDKLPRVAETFEIEGHKAFVRAAPEPETDFVKCVSGITGTAALMLQDEVLEQTLPQRPA